MKAGSGAALALRCVSIALANTGADLSNGPCWWDGFHFSASEVNIYGVKEISPETTIRWKVRDKKTVNEVISKVRVKLKYAWVL